MLEIIREEKTRVEIQAALGLKGRANSEERYLKPAIKMGLVDMTRLDKPRSSKQRYPPTGPVVLENFDKESQS